MTTAATLADQQAALIAALAAAAPLPAGFDATRLRAAADALAFKRARAVAQAWPSLVRMLGDDFRTGFAAYAAAAPIPHGGPLADGRCFARHLAADKTPLSDDVRLQALSIDVRYRQTPMGLTRRRWPRVGAAWLRDSRSAVLCVGERTYRFALPRLGR